MENVKGYFTWGIKWNMGQKGGGNFSQCNWSIASSSKMNQSQWEDFALSTPPHVQFDSPM